MRRNPDATPTPKSSGLKNWLILGVVGVGGYFAFKYITSSAVKDELKNATSARLVTDPDLNGPMVTKFGIFGTRTKTCIDQPVKGFAYSPIASTNPITGNNVFSATVTGHFTRRLLCKGTQKYAEIKPL